MKLKALPQRLHNIYFHTHTVSGIVLSFALFVIFYAGSFALFKDEIYRWENPEARIETNTIIDYDQLIKNLQAEIPNLKIDDHLSIAFPAENLPMVRVYAEIEQEDGSHEWKQFFINPNTLDSSENAAEKTTVGETLYHLHYFAQIPTIGLYLSGLVALFFLFATITGILIHWKNILQKFYAYTTKGKLKTIWTNAHTVLGVLTIPFQLIFAVTGALFGLLTLLLAPSALVLFNGDTGPIFETFSPQDAIVVNEDAPAATDNLTINELYEKVQTHYPEQEIVVANFHNYGRTDGNVSFYVDDARTIRGDGTIVYALQDGEILAEITPNKKTYSQTIYNLLIKLHFGTFGGLALKIIYFILAMIVCYMLISGILIWKVARDKKEYSDKQKRFHHRVTKAYLAICLSLFPAVALIFLANKLVPWQTEGRIGLVNSIFFIGWLLFIIIGLLFNNYRKLNNLYLIVGGLLAICVPIANGTITGDWIWNSATNQQWQVFSVDLFWLSTGISALVGWWFWGKEREVIVGSTSN